MALMAAGLALFLGLHTLPVVRPVHQGAIALAGNVPYRIVYSIGSLVGLILIAEGYKAWLADGSAVLYVPPTWLSHISLVLMAFAFVFVAATYTKGYIKRAVKHPMILGVKLWAFAHLLSNGHAAAVVLFAAFLAWGVVERISVKRREAAGEIAPRDFEPRWSGDLIAVAVGLSVYVLFVWRVHLWLIGVSPIAM